MTDREKLAKLLECCEEICTTWGSTYSEAADYLIAHGVTVRQMQKPLAWVDVIELGKLPHSIVWIEKSKKNCTSPNVGWHEPVSLTEPDGEGVYRFTGEIDFYAPGIETETCCTKSCYGKTWRCWAEKPTDEERMAAAWL